MRISSLKRLQNFCIRSLFQYDAIAQIEGSVSWVSSTIIKLASDAWIDRTVAGMMGAFETLVKREHFLNLQSNCSPIFESHWTHTLIGLLITVCLPGQHGGHQ